MKYRNAQLEEEEVLDWQLADYVYIPTPLNYIGTYFLRKGAMIINFYVDEIVVNNCYVCNLGFAQKLNFSLIIFRRNYVSQVI